MAGQKMRPAFYALHAATLDPATTTTRLAELLRAADAVTERHRLSEGAVYASACRRYLLDTGRSWKAAQTAEGATTWDQSDHRVRITFAPSHHVGPTAGAAWGWRCSCGERAELVAETEAGAYAAHTEHARLVSA